MKSYVFFVSAFVVPTAAASHEGKPDRSATLAREPNPGTRAGHQAPPGVPEAIEVNPYNGLNKLDWRDTPRRAELLYTVTGQPGRGLVM